MSSTSSTSSTTLSHERNNLIGLVRTMRPRQWIKSLIVYAALVFDGKLLIPELFLKTTLVFAAFCLLSSSVYIVNDLMDMEQDRQHPRKRSRPLASGQLAPRFAAVAAGLIGVVAIALAFWVETWAGALLLLYLAQNIAYSIWLSAARVGRGGGGAGTKFQPLALRLRDVAGAFPGLRQTSTGAGLVGRRGV